ncbi:MAG: DUF5590 domain-containing protein [Sporolactobacillus sp.]|nr:DUF5590 domain-containing protein [Sporolactobacillus sp.]MCI1882695.1 DUF5590 domain-containing protein [Sporolactobacillus sp.]
MKNWIIPSALCLLLLLCFGGWEVYANNLNFNQNAAQAAASAAKKRYPLQKVESVSYYHGTRPWQVVKGVEHGKGVYIWVPDGKGRSAMFQRYVSKGISEKEAVRRLNRLHLDVRKIISVRLGAIGQHPVWEVTFLNSKNNYNYLSFYFDNGKEAQRILNV